MEFVNPDGTSQKATTEDLLRMAGIATPALEPCTISEALTILEDLIDGQDPEEDPMAGTLTPIHRLLLRLQIDSPEVKP